MEFERTESTIRFRKLAPPNVSPQTHNTQKKPSAKLPLQIIISPTGACTWKLPSNTK